MENSLYDSVPALQHIKNEVMRWYLHITEQTKDLLYLNKIKTNHRPQKFYFNKKGFYSPGRSSNHEDKCNHKSPASAQG